ncbi:MAG TPA: hypothetical protein VMZ53_12020 [Kofleriaceae bacterium]|nr:hypothetical protein [Kofleriaceae bacterium]
MPSVRYQERSLAGEKQKLIIKPGHIATQTFDIDVFGHDDGSSRDPNDSFRLIFQLGYGYFIYLFVVGMAQPDGLGRFTSFWLKDIVAVDIEMEEYGAPSCVEGGPYELPVNWGGVTLWRGDQETARFSISGCAFEATTKEDDKLLLTMRWRLSDGGVLSWTSATTNGWHLFSRQGDRELEAGEYVTFIDQRAT